MIVQCLVLGRIQRAPVFPQDLGVVLKTLKIVVVSVRDADGKTVEEGRTSVIVNRRRIVAPPTDENYSTVRFIL